jgi:hypothetical protein
MVIFGVSGSNGTNPTPENLYTLAKHLEKVAIKNSVEVFITAKVSFTLVYILRLILLGADYQNERRAQWH